MEQTFDYINEFLKHIFAYGPIWIYLILIAASFVENIFPPFPGDFFTLAGGALAAGGWLNIFGVFACVYIGGIGSTIFVYHLGKRYGLEYFIRKDFKVFSAQDIISLEEWFSRRGAWLLIFSRFIVGARAVIALVSGISQYRKDRFILFTSISFWFFNGLLLFSSYLFVVNFETIAKYFHAYEKIAWPIIIAVIVGIIIWKILKVRKNGK
ncbi:MAG: VTT domain-containing protein [Candidatus Zixiibacteriota bacterium]